MNKKICSQCKIIKKVDCYYKHYKKKFGVNSICKRCSKINSDKFVNKNSKYIKEYLKCYYKDNADIIKLRAKNYHNNNKEHVRKYQKEYRLKNKERCSLIQRNYYKKHIKEDVGFRIKRNLQKRIWDAVRGHCKYDSTKNLVGCSVEELKQHLESQFKEGMSWDNYGRNGWEIDHIKPCASFDLSKLEEQHKCFHYTNLQPLYAIDNSRKGCKIKD